MIQFFNSHPMIKRGCKDVDPLGHLCPIAANDLRAQKPVRPRSPVMRIRTFVLLDNRVCDPMLPINRERIKTFNYCLSIAQPCSGYDKFENLDDLGA